MSTVDTSLRRRLYQNEELMGHRTIAMTCRYAHLAPAHNLAAVEKLDPKPVLVWATSPRTSTQPRRKLAAASGTLQ
jgi:hypothetical protein